MKYKLLNCHMWWTARVNLHFQVKSLCEKAKEILSKESNVQEVIWRMEIKIIISWKLGDREDSGRKNQEVEKDQDVVKIRELLTVYVGVNNCQKKEQLRNQNEQEWEQCGQFTFSRWNAPWPCVEMSTVSSTTLWSSSGLEVRLTWKLKPVWDDKQRYEHMCLLTDPVHRDAAGAVVQVERFKWTPPHKKKILYKLWEVLDQLT